MGGDWETGVREGLLGWFDENRREMPWRSDRPVPYRVWVSEVMLQQTRMGVVEPAYRRFIRAFPSLRSLARAEEDDVLSLWSGLGYYSRARNLHRAAKTLVDGGRRSFPRTWDEARELPGVGPYIAAAVLSIAYDQPYAAVDGNVIRVLSRLRRLGRPDARQEPHQSLADRLLATDRPGDWNQAVMELGETICLPKAALCPDCPIQKHCEAWASDTVSEHPPPKQRRETEFHLLDLTILQDDRGSVLLERGGFRYLDHLWLPPSRVRPAPHSTRTKKKAPPDFRHMILHREFAVAVETKTVSTSALRERAHPSGTKKKLERRIFSPTELTTIGRSSLLTKALRVAARPNGTPRDRDTPAHEATP